MIKKAANIRNILTGIVLVCFCSCADETNNSNVQVRGTDNASKPDGPLFEMVPETQSHIDFANIVTESDELNIVNYHYFYNGGGVACGDINNDGLIDLYFTANQLPNKLYLNKGGLEFEDISDKLPVIQGTSWCTGATMVDINADGLLDIYVCRSGDLDPEYRKNLLLVNQGNLVFEEQAGKYGLDDPAYSTQATFFDYDKDGDLDMFLLNHEIKDIVNYNRQLMESGVDPMVGDKLYRNDNNKFIDVSSKAGIKQTPYGFGLGVAVGDLNGDNWPDVYVSNDFIENDYLYYNNKNGTFTETIHSSTQHISNYGMGADIADINNDGLQDILVVDMVAKDNYRQKTNMSGMNPALFWQTIDFGIHYQYMGNTLQLNQGGGKFSEVGHMTGITNTDWSWSALMADLDNDGNKDILITNGLRKEIRNNDFVANYMKEPEKQTQYRGLSKTEILHTQLSQMPSQRISNFIFQNQENLKFEDKTSQWGLGLPSFCTGAAYADLDNDGDLDLVMNNVDEKIHLYENRSNRLNGNNYLTVKLVGPDKNPLGIGAEITVTSDQKKQKIELYQTRGFQSCVPAHGYFGLGEISQISSVEVVWPDGKKSQVLDPEINRQLIIDYTNSVTQNEPIVPVPNHFQNITSALGINYVHQENVYDDFSDQVLLPHKLSNLGPALAVADVNNDGLQDFYIGGASGYSGYIYMQRKNGKFERIEKSFHPAHRIYEDIDAAFFDSDGDGDLDLYVVSGGYEFDSTSNILHDRLYENDGNGNFTYAKDALPTVKVSGSCVRPFDIDKDGDIDLFIGGRLIPKHYPMTPKSYLLINENGTFKDQTSNIAPELQRIGMVTDAEWMDVDEDSQEDLIVTGEWMPICVFKGNNGQLTLITNKNNGLEKSNGWWYSLQKVDVDSDGDMDVVAGNLGLNYKYKASEKEPFKVFSDDFDNNAQTDIVLGYAEDGTYYPVRGRECSSQQMPYIKEKFPDYKSFGKASLNEVLGSKLLPTSLELNAFTFASTVFENKGDMNFEPIPFYHQAQLSSINDIVADDLNEDGIPDLIMAGNLLFSEVETPRNDAGYGLIMLGSDGNRYESIPAPEVDFFGEGEVKKIKPVQVGNKYTAYLVAQNNGPLKAFRYK